MVMPDDTPGPGGRAARPPLFPSQDAIGRLVHDLHPTPVGRGIHLDDVRRTYPGWEFGPLVSAVRASGVLRRDLGHPPFRSGPHLHALVVCSDGTTLDLWRGHAPPAIGCICTRSPRVTSG